MSNVKCVDGDILEARAFCNPVNLVGAMGKGLAAQVARRWPACVGAYRAALQTRALRAGTVSAWRRRDGGWILQVPTKRHWRDRSPLELVAASIRAIGPACTRHGITEIAVPPLGCGLGGLDPAAVRPLVLEAAAAHPGIEWVLHRWPETASEGSASTEPIAKLGKAEVRHESFREILTSATGFISSYDYTLNPYAGCTYGCTYCYAAAFTRTDADRDAWGRWVTVKENAIERLGRWRGRLAGRRIYMSSVTDPYQPIERKLKLTRRLLEGLAGERVKLVIQTRSPDVVRDIDLLERLENGGGKVQVNMTVTTDDERLRTTFEPWCPSNRARLKAVAALTEAGVRTAVTITPVLRIADPEGFADALAATGCSRFIIQQFHADRGNEQFVAGTRSGAIELMADQLGVEARSFGPAYREHYEAVRTVLRARWPDLGEGRQGFRPPF